MTSKDLILRSRAKRGVSKDGQQRDCIPPRGEGYFAPIETHRSAVLLRVRQ